MWGKKKIAIIFVVLLIVCAAIVAVVLNINKTNKDSDDGSEGMAAACSLNTFEETATCIEEVYVNNGDIKEFVDIYDMVINNAEMKDNYDLASKLIVQRATSLVNYGYCDRAVDVLGIQDFSGYDTDKRAYVYSRAASISLECGNDEARKKWTDLMMETQKELQYEAF